MLRLKIEGDWEPQDFIEILTSVESLYYKALTHPYRYSFHDWRWFDRATHFYSYEDRLDSRNSYLLSDGRKRVYGYQRLHVAQIKYASPGKLDLLGVGEAFKSIEGIIDRLIIFFTERYSRKERDKQARISTQIKQTELKHAKESLNSLKIENAHRLLEIHRDFPEEFEEALIALIVRDQDNLIERIAERKLVGIKQIGKKEEQD